MSGNGIIERKQVFYCQYTVMRYLPDCSGRTYRYPAWQLKFEIMR